MDSRKFGYGSSAQSTGNGYYSSGNGFFSQPAHCPPPTQQITVSHAHGGFFSPPHYHQSNCAPDPFHGHHHGHHGHHSWKHW